MKGTTQTLRQRRQGLHFFHNQVVFLMLESHFHNSMSSIYMRTFFSSRWCMRSAQVVEKLKVISTKLLPCFS
jgi:hypothetical protein